MRLGSRLGFPLYRWESCALRVNLVTCVSGFAALVPCSMYTAEMFYLEALQGARNLLLVANGRRVVQPFTFPLPPQPACLLCFFVAAAAVRATATTNPLLSPAVSPLPSAAIALPPCGGQPGEPRTLAKRLARVTRGSFWQLLLSTCKPPHVAYAHCTAATVRHGTILWAAAPGFSWRSHHRGRQASPAVRYHQEGTCRLHMQLFVHTQLPGGGARLSTARQLAAHAHAAQRGRKAVGQGSEAMLGWPALWPLASGSPTASPRSPSARGVPSWTRRPASRAWRIASRTDSAGGGNKRPLCPAQRPSLNCSRPVLAPLTCTALQIPRVVASCAARNFRLQKRCICKTRYRHVSDFDLRKLMYNGAISMVYHAVDKRSGITVALKLYKRIKLNEIERHQVSCLLGDTDAKRNSGAYQAVEYGISDKRGRT